MQGCPCTRLGTSDRSTSRSRSGFLFAAWRPARIPGLLPVVAALVACLVGSSLLDVLAGNTGALGEAHHATDFAGLAVLWLLSRGVAHSPVTTRPELA